MADASSSNTGAHRRRHPSGRRTARGAAEEGIPAQDRRGQSAVEQAVQTLAPSRRWRTPSWSAATIPRSIEAMIAELDKKLSEQVNLIIHHADFQKREGAWRGLHHTSSTTPRRTRC